jgi:hypothetical protein
MKILFLSLKARRGRAGQGSAGHGVARRGSVWTKEESEK